MAEAKTTKKGDKKKPASQFVTKKEFEDLNDGVSALADLVGGLKDAIEKSTAAAKTPAQVKEETEIASAGPEDFDTNREWDKMAKDIIGAAVERTEVKDLKGGGRLFTVVIKEKYSNAKQDYLERHKVDRRSKEIGTEGEAGVETWCKLIRNNLKRGEKPMIDARD